MSGPIPGYNFAVRLLDTATMVVGAIGSLFGADTTVDAGFRAVRGLEGTLETERHEEGGLNDRVRIFPTRMSWNNLTLERGVGLSDELWDWYADYLTGRGRRRDGLVVLLNDRQVPVIYWKFIRGLPVRWTGPTLDAQNNGLAIETLEIAHEGLDVQSGPGLFSPI